MSELMTIEQSVQGVMTEAKNLVAAHPSINIDAEQNYAIQQLYKNDFSTKVALANPVSVQNAVRNLSSIGISLNPALKHAYLVPRDGAICLDVSYMGLMHLAQQEGAIEWGQAKLVYANDTYTNQGADQQPEHKYQAFGDRGEKVGVYCVAKLPSGDFLTEEMSAEQVNQVRNTSKAKDSSYSPWKTFEDEMWRKTVVKRASKYWPKSGNRLDAAIHVLNEHEGIETIEPQIDNIKKLEQYAGDKHTALELHGFMEYVRATEGEDAYIELHKRFPAGLKSSGKQKLREGGAQFRQYIEIFLSGSESDIEECKEEMTQKELQIINRAMKKFEHKDAA